MIWPWRLGMLVLTGIPAIVGGGLMWHLFKTWTAVMAWDAALLCLVIFAIFKGGRIANADH